MKRSRHRWLGLTLFCLILALLATELPSTSALKATSLIFGKTSTTAAPEEAPSGEGGSQDSESDGIVEEETNTTSKYTGNPQVDYVYDPNLPRELNGYNLSDYPFYATVPKLEDINFKCQGLHDGFYAAVAHKCQVYHHCLFGTRYDFLCANYTAFDQRTFICQFVSEVDCENSPKFWDRNEALYKATTAAPVPTTPSTTTTTTTTQRPQRPLRRRRPYYDDYYDDYYNARDDYEYEERPRRRRPQGRPGAKKRPVDDDYDDERYDRRRPGTARGRPSKRPYDRRTYEEDEDEDRRPYRSGSRRPRPRDEDEDDDIRPTGRDTARGSSRDTGREDRDDVRPRRPVDDDVRPKRPVDDDVRPVKRPVEEPREDTRPKKSSDDEELRPLRPVDYNKPRKEYRPRNDRPVVSDDDFVDAEVRLRDRDEIRPRDEKRPRDEIRSRDDIPPRDEIRPRDEPRASARDEYKPKEESRPESRPHNFRSRDERKPYDRDQEGPRLRGEDRYQSKGRRYEDRPTREDKPRDDRPRPFRERNYDEERVEKKEATTSAAGLVKPVGQGIFAQPRMPPKIKRPVPVNAKDKFEYVPVVTTTKAPKLYDDEYEDYDEEDIRRPSSSGKSSAVQQRPIPEPVEKERFKPTRSHLGNKANRRPIDYDDEYYDEPPKTQKVKEVRNRSKSTDDYYYDYDDKQDRRRQKDSVESKVKGVRMNVRVVKRPFLPSRGGSPYLPRGLQPVGGRDVTAPINTTPRTTTSTSTTSEPITNPITTTTSTTTTTTTEAPTTRTTTRPTTKPTTTAQTTTELKAEEEYEYYEEEEDYDKKKESTTPVVETTTKVETTTFVRTTVTPKTTVRTTTPKPETTTTKRPTTEQQAKHLATKVLRVYNENYEAIRDKLESTLSPGDYVKPYLATSKPVQEYRPKVQPHPEISKPYTATGKPFINENIYIKQNLADSIESDYDVRLNEALAPKFSPRIPTGFSIPDRDYTFSRYRNIQPEPQFAASEISNFQVRKRQQMPAVSLRTPNSFFIQPQRMMFDDLNRFPRQLYRPEFF